MQYLDDMIVGTVKTSPDTYTFTADNIKAFAREWDPMPFHIDEDLAAASPIGKLFATSIHTMAVAIRLSHSMLDEEVAAIAGLGWQDVSFPKPATAGMTVHVQSELVDKRESRSKPDRGIITTLNKVLDESNDVVAEYKILTMVLKRP